MTEVTLKPSRPSSIGGLKIKAATEITPDTWGMCMAIYGPPGVGKTTNCAKLANSPWGSPAIIIDAEGGTRSVTHIPNLDIVEVKDWRELTTVSIGIQQSGKNCPWKTVIIDNMSEIQAISVRGIAQGEIPQIQHWNRSTADMLQFTRLWRDFARFNGINVIFIAWSAPDADESTGVKIIKQDVGFTPSLARQFPGIVDIVGYMTIEGTSGIRNLIFAPSTRTAAKFRRSNNEVAAKIPLVIRFNEKMSPLEDIVGTLKGGLPWPTEHYNLKTTEDKKE